MKASIVFDSEAFEKYIHWANEDLKVFNKITDLIKDIQRNHFKGLGKPEPLKFNYKGCWSRRITDEHRLIYKIENNKIYIISCHGHYE